MSSFRVTAAAALLLTLATPAFAKFTGEDMPAPNRAPRTPVESSKLNGGADVPAEMAGVGQALDGQTIRLHDSAHDLTVRLLGVVAPPLTTGDGATARATLDQLLHGQTLDCQRRDRAGDGTLVMSCTYNGGKDLSEALLFTGTALFTRGSGVDADLAVRYRAAEETAQMRRLGLWHNAIVQTPAVAAPAVATAVAAKESAPVAKAAPVSIAASAAAAPIETGSGFAMAAWLQTLGLLAALFGMLLYLDTRHTRRTRLEHDLDTTRDRQVLAAALTGELAAARDICEARAAQIASGGEAKWPRLRTYIFQAHAEQIGLLGAVLARQIASIYGQMSDYGAGTRGGMSDAELQTPAAMTRALTRLCGYVEITLEGLAEVEHHGQPYYPSDDAIEAEGSLHASQIAQPAQRPAAPKPVAAMPAGKRIAAPVADSHDDNNGDDGEPLPVAEAPRPATNVIAKARVATPVAAPEVVETPKAAPTTVNTAASRAARRAALQQKARQGALFKAEQALADTNAALGAEESEDGTDLKTA